MGNQRLANAAKTGLLLLCIIIIGSCRKAPPPVKIGFVGNMTGGKTAILSIGARNGALLAVDDINAGGGLQGRKFQLIIKDDQYDPEIAVKVDQELIRENVAAIVGHVHSDMCLAVLPTVNRSKRVMISPVAPANQLTGIDDYLFKINPPITETSVVMAEYAYQHGIRTMVAALEQRGEDYPRSKLKLFTQAFEAVGGQVITKEFVTGEDASYPQLAADMVQSSGQGYFIIANPLITALICQHLRRVDATGPIYISPWAYHPVLLQNGGSAVEGVIMVHSFQKESRTPVFMEFKERFHKRYKTLPGLWETFSYEAVMVLYQALSRNPDPGQLKATMLNFGRFDGLQGDIVFDRFGDNRRKPMVLTVKDGAFVEIP